MTASDEEAAKQVLAKAIGTYHEAINPGEYVSAWVLITHRQSIELEQRSSTVVGTLVPTDQSWVETRGLLSAAFDEVRFGVSP